MLLESRKGYFIDSIPHNHSNPTTSKEYCREGTGIGAPSGMKGLRKKLYMCILNSTLHSTTHQYTVDPHVVWPVSIRGREWLQVTRVWVCVSSAHAYSLQLGVGALQLRQSMLDASGYLNQLQTIPTCTCTCTYTWINTHIVHVQFLSVDNHNPLVIEF